MTTTKVTPWPYDAIEDDPLTALRIPVTSSHPRRAYLAAFHGVPDRYLDPDATTQYYDRDGNEIEYWTRIVIPIADPLPPYNRGRTIIPEVRAQYYARSLAQEN